MTTPELATKIITGEELYEMGDVGRCELVEGRIVQMSPTKPQHGQFEYRVANIIDKFAREKDLGVVMVGEVGIYTGRNPDTIRAADVLFISHDRLARATPNSFLDVAPELIVEILSPGDRWSDVRQILRDYFDIGVTLVILVEQEAKVVSAYRSPTDFVELDAQETLLLDDVLPGFSLPLSDLFASS